MLRRTLLPAFLSFWAISIPSLAETAYLLSGPPRLNRGVTFSSGCRNWKAGMGSTNNEEEEGSTSNSWPTVTVSYRRQLCGSGRISLRRYHEIWSSLLIIIISETGLQDETLTDNGVTTQRACNVSLCIRNNSCGCACRPPDVKDSSKVRRCSRCMSNFKLNFKLVVQPAEVALVLS
jgi:hypothetical protein